MENYTLWSRVIEIALLGRNKVGFIDGSVLRTDFDGALKKIWNRYNAIVISWLICNMSKDLLSGILYSSGANQVWLDLNERFDKVNRSRLYQLHKNIFTLTQGTLQVSSYYTKLKNLWDEYDSILPPPSCDCNKAKDYVEQMQYQRLLQFLMGLNDSYSQARGQILMMTCLPNVNQAYALIIQDESQKGIVGSVHEGMESLALYTASNFRSSQPISRQAFSRRNFHSLFCDFCNMKGDTRAECNKLKKCDHYNATGHVKEDCFQLIGNPKNFKGKKKVNAVMGDSAKQKPMPFMQDQLAWKAHTVVGEKSHPDLSHMGEHLTHDQLLQMLNESSPAQLNQILNVKNLLYRKVKGIGEVEDGLYVLNWNTKQHQNKIKSLSAVGSGERDPELWHKRLGHVPLGCMVFPKARQTRVPFPMSHTTVDDVFYLVHMDVWGPYKVATHNGMKYFLTLVDDKSRWTWTFFIALKSDVVVVLRQFLIMIMTPFGKSVKVFRSDNGREFVNNNCHDLFVQHGIIHQRSCPHSPQQNGVVERKHRHLKGVFLGNCITLINIQRLLSIKTRTRCTCLQWPGLLYMGICCTKGS